MKLTKAQIRALQAVKAGQVTRVYDRNGHTLHSSVGTGTKTLWALDRHKLMRDGPDSGGALITRCTQVLTPAGEDALASALSPVGKGEA